MKRSNLSYPWRHSSYAIFCRSGKEAEIVKVEDIAKITGDAVLMTPALVIDGVVKAAGKVLSVDEIGLLFTSV